MASLFLSLFFSIPFFTLSSLFPLSRKTFSPVNYSWQNHTFFFSFIFFLSHFPSLPGRCSCIPLNFPIIFQLSHDMENIFGTSTYFVYFLFLLLVILISLQRWKQSDLAFTTSPWMFGKLRFTYFIYSSIFQLEGWRRPDVIFGDAYSTER